MDGMNVHEKELDNESGINSKIIDTIMQPKHAKESVVKKIAEYTL